MSRRSLMLPPPKNRLLDMVEEATEVIVVAIVGAKEEPPHVVAVAEDSAGIKSVTSSKATTMTTSFTVHLPTNLNVTSKRRKI